MVKDSRIPRRIISSAFHNHAYAYPAKKKRVSEDPQTEQASGVQILKTDRTIEKAVA